MNDSVLVQLKDMPDYLSMSKSTFDRWVRHEIPELRLGRCVLFSKIEIQRWIANTEQRYECPNLSTKGDMIWDKKERSGAFTSVRASGISTSKSTDGGFAKVLAQRKKQKQSYS